MDSKDTTLGASTAKDGQDTFLFPHLVHLSRLIQKSPNRDEKLSLAKEFIDDWKVTKSSIYPAFSLILPKVWFIHGDSFGRHQTHFEKREREISKKLKSVLELKINGIGWCSTRALWPQRSPFSQTLHRSPSTLSLVFRSQTTSGLPWPSFEWLFGR